MYYHSDVTQVSRFKLRPEVEKRIYSLLVDNLVGFRDKEEFNSFLDDFLSPIEKTILAKRLAIAVLIAKGNDYQNIREILKVTPGTISKMSLHMKYGNGAVRRAAERVLLADSNKALLQELASVFDVPTKGLPLSGYHAKVTKREQKIYSLQKEL